MADSSYIIDVAASMPDAGVTTAQLDELSASLISAGADAEALDQAALHVGQQLRAAAAAVTEANAALAEGNARYSELETAALRAAKAAERAALKNGGVVPADLQAQLHGAVSALEQEAHALARLEQEAQAAAKAEAHLGQTQANIKKLSSASAGAFSEQAAAAKKSVREAEGMVPLVKQYNDFTDAISTSEGATILATGAAIGLAAAVAAVTVAVAAGTIAIAAWAVGLADAKREAGLTEEAAAVLEPQVAGLAEGFGALTEETGVGAAQLRKFAKQLDAAKVSAEDMPAQLRAVALSSAAMGQDGVSAYLDRLKDAKGATAELADEVSGKLGGIVAKKMMGLDAQSAKLKKNFTGLFDGLNIDPVLEGFRVLVDLFDKNTAAGEAMQFIFESIFQPLIDQATNAAYVVEAFVLGFLIGMTKLYIAVKPAIKAAKEFFGFEDTSLSDTLDIAKIAGEALVPVFLGIVATITIVGGIIGFLVAQLFLIPAAAAAVVAAVVWLGVQIWDGIGSAFQKVTDFLNGLIPGFGDLGGNLIKGLINGITGGAAGVVSAIVNVAKGAITAAKNALGIHSPSTVFADIGGFTAEGFVQGVDDGSADAQAAMTSMVEPPAPGDAYAAAATSGKSAASGGPGGGGLARGAGGGVHIEIGTLAIGAGVGPSEAKAAADTFVERVTELLEQDAAAVSGEEAA